MPKPTTRQLAAILWAIVLLPIAAIAADGESIMITGGSNRNAVPCITCHGADGKGMPAAGFPRLAGLPAPYIIKQLYDVRNGLRQIPVMQVTANGLTEEEIEAVAKAYAALPKVNVTASKLDRPMPGTGAWIALRGAWERNIPECTLCHGPSGLGVGDTFPPLAGQSALYIESQLKAWRSASPPTNKSRRKTAAAIAPVRHNDPNGLMQHIAASLTESEIKAVAEYFGSLNETSEPFDESQHRLLR